MATPNRSAADADPRHRRVSVGRPVGRGPENRLQEPRLRFRQVFGERGVGDPERRGDLAGVGPAAVLEVAHPVGRPDDFRLALRQRPAVDDHRVPSVGVGVRPNEVPDRHPVGDGVERGDDLPEPIDVGQIQREQKRAVGRAYVGNRAVQPFDDVAGAGGVGVAGELVDAVGAHLHHRFGARHRVRVAVDGGRVDAELLGDGSVRRLRPRHVADRRRLPVCAAFGRREFGHRTGGRNLNTQFHADPVSHHVVLRDRD